MIGDRLLAMKDVVPGQTVICQDTPSLVAHTHVSPNGMVGLTFLPINRAGFVQMWEHPDAIITISPLAPTG